LICRSMQILSRMYSRLNLAKTSQACGRPTPVALLPWHPQARRGTCRGRLLLLHLLFGFLQTQVPINDKVEATKIDLGAQLHLLNVIEVEDETHLNSMNLCAKVSYLARQISEDGSAYHTQGMRRVAHEIRFYIGSGTLYPTSSLE
jgi:hypothetical protein